MQLSGANVLITGASRGIGEALARACAAKGAKVALAARNASQLDALATELGSGASAHPIDLSEPAQVEGWIAKVEASIGAPIDVLINNAGLDHVGYFADRTAHDVRNIHEVNLLAPIELCRQVVPSMMKRGSGHIVNVSSTAACGAFSGLAMYGSTKAGLSNFTRILRHEIKGSGIGTTVVSLGPVPTDMLSGIDDYEPARRSFERFRKLQLMPNVDKHDVARKVAAAIEANKAHVRMPSRAAVYPAMAEIPQSLVNVMLKGIDRKPANR